MDVETIHPEVAFGNLEGIGPTDRFGPTLMVELLRFFPPPLPHGPSVLIQETLMSLDMTMGRGRKSPYR